MYFFLYLWFFYWSLELFRTSSICFHYIAEFFYFYLVNRANSITMKLFVYMYVLLVFILYSQTHAAYTFCKILNAIPFAYIYMINQSPDFINTIQYKIAGLLWMWKISYISLKYIRKSSLFSTMNNEVFLPL
jgi:hypothetical protein